MGALARRVSSHVPLIDTLRGYKPSWLKRDMLGAVELWAVLVPQSLAFARLAQIPPTHALYASIGSMILYALFGGSRFLNIGPESATAVLCAVALGPLAGGDAVRYAGLAALLAMTVGIFLLLGFVLRLSFASRLLSTPVLVGYLSGIAVLIAAGQLKTLFGFTLKEFITGDQLALLQSVAWWGPVLAIASAAVVLAIRRWVPAAPGALFAAGLATIVVFFIGAEEHGLKMLGSIGTGLPRPGVPPLSVSDLREIIAPAASIALVVFVDSLLCAKALAERFGDPLDTRQEFLGLGAANVASGLFQGFPVSASNTRTALLAVLGVRSQVTGLVGTAFVVITLLWLTPYLRWVPVAALAGIIIATAVQLVELETMRRLWRVRRIDLALAAVTFVGVLALGVLEGIVVGMAASLAEMVRRVMMPHTAVLGNVPGTEGYRDLDEFSHATVIPGLVVYRFDAPLFFGNADIFEAQVLKLVKEADEPVREVVVNAESINDLDVSAVDMIERLHTELKKLGVRLVFARTKRRLRAVLHRTDTDVHLGEENFFFRVEDAAEDFKRRWESKSRSMETSEPDSDQRV